MLAAKRPFLIMVVVIALAMSRQLTAEEQADATRRKVPRHRTQDDRGHGKRQAAHNGLGFVGQMKTPFSKGRQDMKIEHVSVWAQDLERLRAFYQKYFGAQASDKYTNPAKKFSSYFLSFESGARLEIMQMDSVKTSPTEAVEHYFGLAHFAISVGSREKVDELTAIFRADGFSVLDGPRHTGDGYYESTVLDPENNRLEITI